MFYLKADVWDQHISVLPYKKADIICAPITFHLCSPILCSLECSWWLTSRLKTDQGESGWTHRTASRVDSRIHLYWTESLLWVNRRSSSISLSQKAVPRFSSYQTFIPWTGAFLYFLVKAFNTTAEKIFITLILDIWWFITFLLYSRYSSSIKSLLC